MSIATPPRRRRRPEDAPTGLGRNVFTTGQIARMCAVAPRTVSKWFDAGKLRGYRIPGSQDRRVTRENLIRFLEEHGIPLPPAITGVSSILYVMPGPGAVNDLRDSLGAGWTVASAKNSIEAGAALVGFRPAVVVVDGAVGMIEGRQIATLCRERPDAPLLVWADGTVPLDGYDLAAPREDVGATVARRLLERA